MTLEEYEIALSAGALDHAAEQWLHRSTRETSLDWLHGRAALVEDSLADLASWPGMQLTATTRVGDMIASQLVCVGHGGAQRPFRRHRWVRREGARIAGETVVCDEGTRWGEQLIAEAERRAQERVALPPLGELRSGLGQRGAVAAPGKPSHLPAIAGPVIDALHAQWNQRSMEAMARLFAAEGRWRGPGDQDGGARQASAWAARLIDAFADGAWMMERGEAEGDLVAVLWRFHGHHVRPYLGEAPTGRRVKLIGSTVVQLDAAGRITDEDTVLDELALQVQLRTPVTWL